MRADRKTSRVRRIAGRLIRWLVGLSILTVVLWLGFILLGRALCHIAIGQIAELTNTRIEAGSVDFRLNGSVFIEKLVISPYKKADSDDTILSAEKVHARFGVGSLLLLRPHLKEIDVNDFMFNAQYDIDTEQWNLSALKLKAPEGGSGSMPLIRLDRGTLQYTKVSKGEVKVAVSVPIVAHFGFDQQMQDRYSFDLKTGTQFGGFGDSHLRGYWKPGLLVIAGGVASTDVPALEMAWAIDYMAAQLKYDQNDMFSLDFRIRKLHSKVSPALDRFALMGPSSIERFPPFAALQKFFREYSPRGEVDINVKASGDLKHLSESTVSGDVDCNNVTIMYDKFRYLIGQMRGRIDFTKSGVTLNNLSGRHGDVDLFFNGWTRGLGPNLEYDVRVTSDNMALDADLFNALGAKQQALWSSYSPSGAAAIDYRFLLDSSGTKVKLLTVELQGVDAVYRRFPYPLKNLTGELLFGAGGVTISNVVSRADGRRIVLDGEVSYRGGERPAYDISIKVNNIPLDPTLHAALPDEQKDLYTEFGPTGVVGGNIRVSRSGPTLVPASFTADLTFKDASLKSEGLPLPVTGITADAVFASDLISIKSFSGRYGDSPVSLEGQIWPGENDQPARYDLSLNFKDTLLNDDLFGLLPESARKVITGFRPEGKIDLSADLSKVDVNDYADYNIRVNCLGNSVNLPQFSYPLKGITGVLKISPDAIEFEGINAVPGGAGLATLSDAHIEFNGRVSLADNAFSSAVFEIDANDIVFDQRLGAALPAGIRLFYDKLLPPSRFDLDLEEVRVFKGDDGERVVDINGVVGLEDCSLQVAGSKIELHADLEIDGLYKTGRGFETCHVGLVGERLGILGKSLGNLTADIDYDKNLRKWTSENLVADCYGGKLTGRLEFEQLSDGPLEYVLQTGFEGVDLKEFLSDTRMKGDSEQDHTTGEMEGSLNVRARVGDSSSRIGTCKLLISDMQVGRLSPLSKLLAVLRFNAPTEFAFDQMFMDSYIRRNELVVRKLDLSGKSVAFYGSGSMDLQSRDVKMNLIARGRRLATSDPSVLGSLLEGLGQAVIKIEVTEDFYDPHVVTKTLPFLKGLDIFGSKSVRPK